MKSTMQPHPLSITDLFHHGLRVHHRREVVTKKEGSTHRRSFAEIAQRAGKLAAALTRLGVKPSDRVGTFCWNSAEHMEAYFGIPCMGAVLHTLNIRLFPEQLTYVVNHAEDKVVIVDDSLVALLAPVADQLETVEHFIVVGDGDASALGDRVLRYEDLLAAESGDFAWPDVDENAAAAMCYTSGTTGNPKGVVYSHRSTWLHSLSVTSGAAFALSDRDSILLIVPMFHANAWGLPYAAWSVGANLVMPGPFLQAEPLCSLIEAERPTFSGAVPTIWNDILQYSEGRDIDFSSLRMIVCGGSAVPRILMERFEKEKGLRIIQGWGMTETSPLAAIGHPPVGHDPAEDLDWRVRTGRVLSGVEMRIVGEDGSEQPWDGESVGELEVRGPWITGSYYRDPSEDKFHDGWLKTGDVGWVDDRGYVQLTDRAKDVIKSGGEWISSVELENEIMAHAGVLEAAVVGVPDARWDERPLACIVSRGDEAPSVEELREFLGARVAKWWIPERWTFIPEVPKTSVGKFDKKVLRRQFADGELEVTEVGAAPRTAG